jgi:hypothetical protein
MSWRITQVFRFRAPLSGLHGSCGDARRLSAAFVMSSLQGSSLRARCFVVRRYCRMINADP